MKDEFESLEDVTTLKDEVATESRDNVQAENGRLVFAGVLILVGLALAIGILTGYTLNNWWALFMLIPVGTMSLDMWQDYQENGRLSKKTSNLIIPIIILLVIVAIFLFNLNWGIIWPASFIAVGLSILLTGRSS
jgi:4-hydroxybenzoate polyprenyltransferase